MSKYRLRRTGAVLAAFFSVVAICPAVATPAYASHAQTANTGVLNTANWRVCGSGGADLWDAIRHAVNLIDATDVNVTYVDCHSGDSNVTVFDINSPETWYAETRCLVALDANNRCSSKSVVINNRRTTTQAQWRMNACHEFGHVAGLGHRSVNDSCMKQGASPPIATTYDPHDTNSINATY